MAQVGIRAFKIRMFLVLDGLLVGCFDASSAPISEIEVIDVANPTFLAIILVCDLSLFHIHFAFRIAMHSNTFGVGDPSLSEV